MVFNLVVLLSVLMGLLIVFLKFVLDLFISTFSLSLFSIIEIYALIRNIDHYNS